MTIRKTFSILAAFATLATTLTVSVSAVFTAHAGLVTSGTSNGISWEARNTIVGATIDGTAGIGNPLYHPNFPTHSGVVALIMERPEGNFICSGTLLEDRKSILTAAHCVSDGAGTSNPIRTRVFFPPESGLAPDQRIVTLATGPAGPVIDVSAYKVHENYTGEVIDQNDIAVLTLAETAPTWATAHGIYTDNDLTGQEFNVAGYGGRGEGTIGSLEGTTGFLRQGDNKYDFAFGNEVFNGYFTDRIYSGGTENFFGTAEVEFSYVSDFDNGFAGNDAAGTLAQREFNISLFDDTGLGQREVGTAGGDSGGPNFINGLLSGINSYGLSFGTNFGDFKAGLNSSFGEFSGYVPTYIHAKFIADAMMKMVSPVSAPGMFALLILSVFVMGASARRRTA